MRHPKQQTMSSSARRLQNETQLSAPDSAQFNTYKNVLENTVRNAETEKNSTQQYVEIEEAKIAPEIPIAEEEQQHLEIEIESDIDGAVTPKPRENMEFPVINSSVVPVMARTLQKLNQMGRDSEAFGGIATIQKPLKDPLAEEIFSVQHLHARQQQATKLNLPKSVNYMEELPQKELARAHQLSSKVIDLTHDTLPEN